MDNFTVIDLLKNHHDRSPVAVYTADGQWLEIIGITEIQHEIGQYVTAIVTK